MYEPQFIERWTLPPYYSGAHWNDYYVFLGRHRDSSILSDSNFNEALKAIGGESETVIIVRESHWAVGWVEWIAIHESDEETLKKADEIAESLQDYPVLNEESYSQAQFEAICDTWENSTIEDRIEWCRESDCSIFSARSDSIRPEVFDLFKESDDYN